LEAPASAPARRGPVRPTTPKPVRPELAALQPQDDDEPPEPDGPEQPDERGPSGGETDDTMLGGSRTEPSAPVSAPTSAPTSGARLTATDVRRLWPEVLEEVKSKRRFTWILLSQNAQVAEVRDGTLLLAMANSGARDSFGRGGSEDVLREALVVVLGTDFRIETMVDAGAGGSAPAASARTPPSAPRPPVEQVPADAPLGQAPVAAAPSARERAVASMQSARPEETVDPDDAADRDDVDVDDGAESHHALLARQLGAEIIVEDDA
ncbi:MAG: hypothetical protein ACRYG2_39090, partial [Janthinobacterium lividum]